MKVAHITPGSGDNFYCENCLRDAALVKAMRGLGHDVVMIPMYLPLQDQGGGLTSKTPIFFGGLNVYLQQRWSFFRRTPGWVDRLFDCRGLLRWIAGRAHMTSARGLGETMLSMLDGENGRQEKELGRLVRWLSEPKNKPDIICLSNILLAGLAKSIKKALSVPVVCLLQDEDGFVDCLDDSNREKVWDRLKERASDIDGFVAVSRYYADVIRERLGLGQDRVDVVRIGVAFDDTDASADRPNKPTIGYLSRMCAEKGLDTLVEAFGILKRNEKLKEARLRIAGGSSGGNKAFIKQLKAKLTDEGLIDDVDFLSSFDIQERLSFLHTISVLTVPEKKPTAYGLYVLEALAAGVVVVEPARGVFPELLGETGGGILYDGDGAETLAAALEPLLLDLGRARELGMHGREGLRARVDVAENARSLAEVFKRVARNYCEG